MGLGLKRTCLSCGAKFYDLEKSPIVCPKCNKKFAVEEFNKTRRGRKKAIEEEILEDEVELGGDEIELLEEEEVEDDVLPADEIEIDDEENSIEELEEDSDRLLVELEEENDDIIESDDGRDN